MIRRLDHVAVAVRSTEAALKHFRDHLGLRVVASDEPPEAAVRLTYLDVGNGYLQLVEPLDDRSPIAEWLADHGEGLHHICFAVDDVPAALRELAPDCGSQSLSSGRGRPAAFVDELLGGVRIELTSFDHAADVDGQSGFLAS
jgi:methylmalonyl-CoA epimerase